MKKVRESMINKYCTYRGLPKGATQVKVTSSSQNIKSEALFIIELYLSLKTKLVSESVEKFHKTTKASRRKSSFLVNILKRCKPP